MVELLTGPLLGASVVNKMQSSSWGNLVIAIDTAIFVGSEQFRSQVA